MNQIKKTPPIITMPTSQLQHGTTTTTSTGANAPTVSASHPHPASNLPPLSSAKQVPKKLDLPPAAAPPTRVSVPEQHKEDKKENEVADLVNSLKLKKPAVDELAHRVLDLQKNHDDDDDDDEAHDDNGPKKKVFWKPEEEEFLAKRLLAHNVFTSPKKTEAWESVCEELKNNFSRETSVRALRNKIKSLFRKYNVTLDTIDTPVDNPIVGVLKQLVLAQDMAQKQKQKLRKTPELKRKRSDLDKMDELRELKEKQELGTDYLGQLKTSTDLSSSTSISSIAKNNIVPTPTIKPPSAASANNPNNNGSMSSLGLMGSPIKKFKRSDDLIQSQLINRIEILENEHKNTMDIMKHIQENANAQIQELRNEINNIRNDFTKIFTDFQLKHNLE